MNYQGSPLQKCLKKALKSEYSQIQGLWTLSPYDWGDFRTSTGETIKVGRDCTLVCLAKLGVNDYRFIIIHEKGTKKNDYVIPSRGYPVKTVVRYQSGRNRLFSVQRRKLS